MDESSWIKVIDMVWEKACCPFDLLGIVKHGVTKWVIWSAQGQRLCVRWREGDYGRDDSILAEQSVQAEPTNCLLVSLCTCRSSQARTPLICFWRRGRLRCARRRRKNTSCRCLCLASSTLTKYQRRCAIEFACKHAAHTLRWLLNTQLKRCCGYSSVGPLCVFS